jgi:hypothetical protein
MHKKANRGEEEQWEASVMKIGRRHVGSKGVAR